MGLLPRGARPKVRTPSRAPRLARILGGGPGGVALDGDLVVVPDPAEVVELVVAGQRRGLRGEALLHAALAVSGGRGLVLTSGAPPSCRPAGAAAVPPPRGLCAPSTSKNASVDDHSSETWAECQPVSSECHRATLAARADFLGIEILSADGDLHNRCPRAWPGGARLGAVLAHESRHMSPDSQKRQDTDRPNSRPETSAQSSELLHFSGSRCHAGAALRTATRCGAVMSAGSI